ncbi:MAG: ADOP family duplicated permease [Gemmatimonadaceae bacterium]
MLSHLRAALTRVRELFGPRSRFADEQDDEFRFHIEMETAENVRSGMREADARRAALVRFGGTQRWRVETRDARGVVAIDNLGRDARFAFRRLRRAPAFAAGVIATLGIGIGAAVGIGTIVYGVLLRDLPYDNPDQLVRVGFHTDGIPAAGDLHSEATYYHFAQNARSFSELGAYFTNDGINVTDGDAPERVTAAMASPNTFTLLGVRPLLGRLFERTDTAVTGDRIPVLISQDLWERRYGADSSIIGRRIELNRSGRIVVGILPRSFDFPSPSVDVYYPASWYLDNPQIASRYIHVIGRLRETVTAADAAAELSTLVPTLSTRFPAITGELLLRSRVRVAVESLRSATVAPVRAQLVLLGFLVAVVLLIATTNVVNLFLLRAERAGHEIAVALSLGASRLALAQRFVIEGVVLGLASAVVALPAAALALSTKFGFTVREIPRLHEVSFTGGTVAHLLGCAILIGAGCGVMGLTRSGMAGVFDRLRGVRSTSSTRWRRAQNGLVAFQVAVALTLLVAAGLLGRSFWNLRSAELGFEPANAMAFQVSLPYNGYASYGEGAAFHAKVLDRLAALPGVTSVAAALKLPLTDAGAPGLDMRFVPGDDGAGTVVGAVSNMANADYFRVIGIPLLSGRSFAPGDLRGDAPAVVISERLATRLFGTTEVVGRTIRRPTRTGLRARHFRVVGVVGDVHGERIEDGYVPTAYFPMLRDADGLPKDSFPVPIAPRWTQYVIRGEHLPAATTILGIVKEVDRLVPPTNIRTLGSLVDDATARVRLTMLLIGVAGAAALLLGVIGVYSVVSYAAAGRVREFGIRLALGAAPKHVGGLVLGDGLKLVAIGTCAGLVAALSATRFLHALLYEVTPTSIEEYALATALLILVTLLATLLPATRAARTHPAVVLRGE